MQLHQAQKIADELCKATPGEAFRAGISILNADFAEVLLPAAERLARLHDSDARISQLLGLAARASGDGPGALAAFGKAARLAPNDALIAHSHARAALESGAPSVALFERASQLAPNDGSVLLGMAASLVAGGRASAAADMLTEKLEQNPLWIDGYDALAQIAQQFGIDPLRQLDAALRANAASVGLHHTRISILLKARRNADALHALRLAQTNIGTQDWMVRLEAHIASELGDLQAADRLFASASQPTAAADLALLARHELRSGRPALVSDLLETSMSGDRSNLLWPYLSLAWRMLDDPRHDWLEGDQSLIGIYDLADEYGELADLAGHLRSLHLAIAPPLDQSVRGGTQTDGNLLLRDEAAIRKLRTLVLEAVARHVAGLSASRPGHPTLLSNRHPQRIAGAWSVRLKESGFHADHVHTSGWLSSAFYVALPESLGKSGLQGSESPSEHAGWLSLGECRELVPGLEPMRLIEPKPGRLVLFPSTMWHGTRSFPSGERITAAFDIALPRQK